MLTFTCDICGNTYDVADIENHSFVYMDANKRLGEQLPTSPCRQCNEEAENAKKEALEKRKAARSK